jgi:hypothetical protein
MRRQSECAVSYEAHVGASPGKSKHHDLVRLRAPFLHAGRADRHARNGESFRLWLAGADRILVVLERRHRRDQRVGDGLPGWAYRIRTGESVRDLPDWNYGLSCPEVDAGGAAETGDSSPTPKCGRSDQRSCCHRNGDLTPNRAQETSGHPERFGLVGFGIGDEAALQTVGRAGSLREKRGQFSGGTGLSGGDEGVCLRGSFRGLPPRGKRD